MKIKRTISLAIVFVMVMVACLGCGATNSSSNSPASSSSAVTAASSASTGSTEEFTYPVKGNVTLTYFGQLHKKVMSSFKSYNDLPIVQKWFEKTGVKLEFNTPAAGMEKEQYNIILASGDLPDIINYDMVGEPGGLQKLYQDKVIIKLTDKMADWAPNLTNYFKENPGMDKLVKDDNGDYFVFPFLKGGGILLATTGPMVREDILKEVGLEAPTTIDEWDKVLQAFKDKYPNASPFLSNWDNMTSCFQAAFGVSKSLWYADSDGKVQFAPKQDGYKQFLMKMNDWYKRGLIDANFATLDNSSIDNAMSAGNALSTFGAGGSSLGAYMTANKDNASYSIIGVQVPTLNKGEKAKYCTEYEFGGNPQVAITTKCKNVEAAMRMYDWGFSEEGDHLLNWGTEGESFTYNDKKEEVYTAEVMKNPDGLSVDAALAKYAMVHIKGPAMLVQDPNYMLQYYSKPQQQQAMKAWTNKDYENRAFPPVSYTSEESDKLVSIMADLETYVQSMALKYVLGSESFDNYDKFISTINSMNIDEAIKIQQAAVDRFNAR